MTMYIEDEELRELYKTSSSEHLSKLESSTLILEKNPQDSSALEEFLREAHTLKGDSRMLGLDDIEMLVHHLEDCVEGIKAGKGEITPELCDRLYGGIDAIDRLAHEAVTGEAVEVDTFEVLASLMGASAVESTAGEADLFDDDVAVSSNSGADLFDDDDSLVNTASEADLFDDDEDTSSSEADLFEESEPITEISATVANKLPVKPPAVSKNDKIDTIRVEPQKLDALMTQASELAVTKLRISQQMTEIEQISALWSAWNRQDSISKTIVTEVEQSLSPEKLQPLKQLLNTTEQRINSLGNLINNLKNRASEDIASLNLIGDRLESGIQDLRQLPLSTVFNNYPRMVRDLARQQHKQIELIIEGGDIKADKQILEKIKDPLLHLIRNAIDHGIETPQERIVQGKSETAKIVLRGDRTGSSIGIEISDDGRGLNLESIALTALRRKVRTEAELVVMSELEIQSLIFESGFSTRTEITELSGRGVGLDVVRANVERLKGSIQVTSTPGNGCKFQVRLNTSLATNKVLIVEVDRTLYALPLESIQTMISIAPQDIYEIEGKPTINFEERSLSITWLASLLQLPTPENYSQGKLSLACIVLQIGSDLFGVIVDDLVDQQDVVLKPQSKLLKRIPNIMGATILGSGEVCMILNPPDLLHSIKNGSWQNVSQPTESTSVKNRLLLVEDSIVIRTQMQKLLKGAGYEVTIAENGAIALHKVQSQDFDLVLSDVEMPQMNGLEMTANIRQNSKYDRLPIVLITTLASPEDKRRGTEAGANAYLTKGDFDQQLLFDTLNRLIYSLN